MIYRRTKNPRAIQLLPGHTKLESTVGYLGIEVDGRADGDLTPTFAAPPGEPSGEPENAPGAEVGVSQYPYQSTRNPMA